MSNDWIDDLDPNESPEEPMLGESKTMVELMIELSQHLGCTAAHALERVKLIENRNVALKWCIDDLEQINRSLVTTLKQYQGDD